VAALDRGPVPARRSQRAGEAMTIRNPIEWSVDQVRFAAQAVESAGHDVHPEMRDGAAPSIARIGLADLREALVRGAEDFGANRSDVILLCIIYPLIGLVLGRLASGTEALPLLFPLAAGFALVGPFAGVGMYEISRRRELGLDARWADALGLVRTHAFGPILLLGLILVALFVLWLMAAQAIYMLTLGPQAPASLGAFIHDVFLTRAGWALIVIGVGVGFLFAVLTLAIGVVSFPLLVERNVGVETAVWTSVRAVAANPGPMAVWGLIVAAGLVIGTIPLFLGLIVILPILGHATWHLYRRVVVYV
jgi:uncharacterized membrane protein